MGFSFARNNSQECRNCHHVSSMVDQGMPSMRDLHESASSGGQTSVDCHKGVAHEAPSETH
ncbi:MAG: NapC/NirT family cytochrome c [Alphaproteobacteria bacterium]